MTDLDNDFRIFRIRGKDADDIDHSKCAWEKHQVGVWYGAWSPEELKEAIKRCHKEGKDAALEYMNNTPNQQRLGWEYTPWFFDTCQRFRGITKKEDWVVVYFEDTLCLGQLCSGIQIQRDHELNNLNGELFHFRHVINQKCFPLTELPDSYRLLASAGRSNVHQHNPIYTQLLKILAKCSNPQEVREAYASMATDVWLDFLSPTEWESLCLGYLIIEYDYVPTGLLPGRTLSIYDLVGKTRDGCRILGQCKKSSGPYNVTEDFLTPCRNERSSRHILWFWFSYGGWDEDLGYGIKLVDKTCIKTWLDTGQGQQYLAVFRG